MTGSLRKRGDKWYYSFEAARVDGKRKRIERVGGRTKKEAEAALRKALEDYENGEQLQKTNISVSDYMDLWFDAYVLLNCRYNTQRSYRLIIDKHIKPSLGILKLTSLTPGKLQDFINSKYLTGISKNHLNNIISLLSGSLNYSVHPMNFLKNNPMQYVKIPKYNNTKTTDKHKIITNDDFNAIIKRFPERSSFYIPLMIGYHTGCRIGEAMGLTWDDIDLDNNTININKLIYKKDTSWYFGEPKTTSSSRIINIGNTLKNALKYHKRYIDIKRLEYGEHYIKQYNINDKITTSSLNLKAPLLNMVCVKSNGMLLTPDSFKYASRVINYELGIPFNFHSLRHTHATLLVENGANIKDVQHRLGHNNIQTTLNTYTHNTDKLAKQSVDIFENIILPTY